MKKFLFGLLVAFAPSLVMAADLSITAANVDLPTSGTKTTIVKFGEAVTEGQVVYKKTADSEYYKADCDVSLSSDDEATVAGIVLTAAPAEGYGVIVTSGIMDVGATLTPGANYVLSGTAGGIAPQADVAQNDWISGIGIAVATDKLYVRILNTAYKVP